MKIVPVFMLAIITCGPVAAQEQPLSIEGLALRNARLLVAGMAFGFGTFDEALISGDRVRLYCPPDDVEINGNLLWQLADEALDGDHNLATVATAVLQRLQTLYPCS